MTAVNHTAIVYISNEAMQILWPSCVEFDDVLLLVTDGASRVEKAAEEFSVSYSKSDTGYLCSSCFAQVL
jgi:hypothetical protein